jgi:hypothetical protein
MRKVAFQKQKPARRSLEVVLGRYLLGKIIIPSRRRVLDSAFNNFYTAMILVSLTAGDGTFCEVS